MTGKDYMALVGRLPCVVCQHLGLTQKTRTTVHHPRIGQGRGQRASDWLGTALCQEHHQGKVSVANRGAFYQAHRLDELDILALTIEAVHNYRGD